MTQVGKCDICRQRKIKCDEVHPVCGGCKKKNRPCHYSYGKVSQFIDDGHLMMDGGKPLTIRRVRDGAKTKKAAPNPAFNPDPDANPPEPLLRLRSSRQTKDGFGLFQTFAPLPKKADQESDRKLPSPVQQHDRHSALPLEEDADLDSLLQLLREPTDETLVNLHRWSNLTQAFDEVYGIRCFLGEWMDLVPLRVGNSQSLDSALDCLFTSITAASNRTASNLAATDASNAKALRRIRADILSRDKDLIANDVLLAITMLTFVEVSIRPITGEFQYHQTGLTNLVKDVSRNGMECSETVQYLIDLCIIWDYLPALLENRDSIYDSPVWMNVQNDFSTGQKTISSNVQVSNLYYRGVYMIRECWIKLPRLSRLTKACARSPADEGLRAEAIELALRLFSLNLDALIQEYFDDGAIKVVPTTAPQCTPYLDHSLTFASFPLSLGLSHYWSLRSMVCGLILHLLDIFPVMPSSYLFDYDQVVAEDLQSAKYLLMSVQFSSYPRTCLPWDSIRHMVPMQGAYGGYRRLALRAGGSESTTAEAKHARRMMEFSIRILKDAETQCGVLCTNMDWKYNLVTGRLPGGPPMCHSQQKGRGR